MYGHVMQDVIGTIEQPLR